uniref:Thioredoxin domain-containing protein n=1 Tax=Neobodo designis TaxID=312471 RepID=A0A7S1L5A6_NEODS|mmetsp:Transcript_15147/g.46972  ORF Transcript_15147/g.46972 Transcript_15147/m.46972 type:complete len:170 (+) Transcript_15147:118-627(+)|eukprot:CAMPEP_0174844046 /NCGR_PEP_ID=MMETSP1114-20130205/10878_1 /TAXON_ID=312471 /ORGANISM="Neobodo designis, Strain CCAP 1951/1" /LENGTH=169 /DNA_ID=CAMNT_0016078279 /DNA_START=115 /DNA_END=624 /DNA_ORIENTATION=+
MADDEVELTEEQQKELELQQLFDERVPPLRSVDDYNRLVRDDVELLVCVVALSSQCPHSAGMREKLMKIAKPSKMTKNAVWFRFDVHAVPALAEQLGVSQVPAAFFTLKGVQWDTTVGSAPERLFAVFKNNLIKRNEVMREHDLAKLPKPADEDEEGEEGEENEEEEED